MVKVYRFGSLIMSLLIFCQLNLAQNYENSLENINSDSLNIGPNFSETAYYEEEINEIEAEEALLTKEEIYLSLVEKLKVDSQLVYAYIPDTIYNVPFYDHYFFWDTIFVHPYVSDLTRMKDTVVINLLDSGQQYVHPIFGRTTSDFGWRRARYHYGIDVKLSTGDSLFAAFDGVVRIVRRSASYGNVIVIRHNNGLETLYAHLSKNKVKINQEVKAGDLIGLGGNTGRSTGPHLHFETRYLGAPINPNDIICFEKGELKMDSLVITASLFDFLKEVRQIRYHTVRRGETLSHISRRYGVSISDLCRLNNLSRKSVLRVGQRIRYS